MPGGGGAGGGTSTSSALVKALESNAGQYRWVAAVSGSENAASLELATSGAPVMAIGGFNNQGGNLTLAQFKQYVARGEIHYYIASTNGAGGGRGGGRPPTGAGARPAGPPSRSGTAHQIAGGAGGPGGQAGGPGGLGGSSSSAITSWVKAHYKTVTVGGKTLYDLTQART
jgi:hypothetical protein